jgi:protein-disulfide isomerase
MKDLKNVLAIPLSIILAGALIAGAVWFTRGGSAPQANNGMGKKPATKVDPVSNKDHILGNPEASVVIVEYSDTECPYCKNFHATMQQVVADYGKDGQVAWVYRHFPLDSIHPKARKEAEATECAAELGGKEAFWSYINKVFEVTVTPSNNKLDPAELPKIAVEIGLDEADFKECLDSGKYADEVDADYQSGIHAGVEGTPYSLVLLKGSDTIVPINGAQPYSVVKQVIDTLLGQKK